MLRRPFLVIFRCWAPCGRRLGALWRLLRSLCRLWGSLWRLWVATWRPKGRSETPRALRPGAAATRVTRFWGPKALFREPKVDGQGPNAIGHGPWATAHGPSAPWAIALRAESAMPWASLGRAVRRKSTAQLPTAPLPRAIGDSLKADSAAAQGCLGEVRLVDGCWCWVGVGVRAFGRKCLALGRGRGWHWWLLGCCAGIVVRCVWLMGLGVGSWLGLALVGCRV